MIENRSNREKTVLVYFSDKKQDREMLTETFAELRLLAATAGAAVVKEFYQFGEKKDARYMLGKGKVLEIKHFVMNNEITMVIFENELEYRYQRNLEQELNCKIIDKSKLILDIFAKNARTAEAKLQVELAQLEYSLPRLTRQWLHFSKQYGGIGTKGPGEKQLEVDRRLIKKRISILKEKLFNIEQQRKTQSKGRKKFFRIALVGYTNSGKSTLLNLLTNANAYVENKLFATLDTSTKILRISGELALRDSRQDYIFLISDTVGFIKNLPHNLIESFKSTLAEVVESDLLLLVVDIVNQNFEEQISIVNNTLAEVGAGGKPIIYVFNKIDKLKDLNLVNYISFRYPNSVFVSALKGINKTQLLEKIRLSFDLRLKKTGEIKLSKDKSLNPLV
ncbi:MAG: GTPase HflX [Ignavibacteria bacterium]